MSTVIIFTILVVAIGLIIRSLLKNRHQCSGVCASCKGCHNSRTHS